MKVNKNNQDSTLMDCSKEEYLYMHKKGSTTIAWEPFGRNIVVKAEEESLEATKLKANGLIDPNTLSDAERLNLGFTSKASEVANKLGEEQPSFEIVAVGSEVSFCKVGDKVMFMPGCQATSITIEGKYYLQLGEFEVLGKFLS